MSKSLHTSYTVTNITLSKMSGINEWDGKKLGFWMTFSLPVTGYALTSLKIKNNENCEKKCLSPPGKFASRRLCWSGVVGGPAQWHHPGDILIQDIWLPTQQTAVILLMAGMAPVPPINLCSLSSLTEDPMSDDPSLGRRQMEDGGIFYPCVGNKSDIQSNRCFSLLIWIHNDV